MKVEWLTGSKIGWFNGLGRGWDLGETLFRGLVINERLKLAELLIERLGKRS